VKTAAILICHLTIPFSSIAAAEEKPALPANGLVLDLDASKGVVLEDGDRVASWKNQAPAHPEMVFVKRDGGRAEAGSGRPSFRKNATADGKPSLVFLQQELVATDEDAFDGLTTGKGHTWIAVIAVHGQRVGVKDVNSFFGNLRNGGKYEGVWGCLDDDNTVWWGTRNGLSFGRFDENNPKVAGAVLEQGKFHVIAGRMDAGTGNVKLSLFVNSPQPAGTASFPVDPAANASRMAIGQERDAIEHPGKTRNSPPPCAPFLPHHSPRASSHLQCCKRTHLAARIFPPGKREQLERGGRGHEKGAVPDADPDDGQFHRLPGAFLLPVVQPHPHPPGGSAPPGGRDIRFGSPETALCALRGEFRCGCGRAARRSAA
jgi:hypothetical protein